MKKYIIKSTVVINVDVVAYHPLLVEYLSDRISADVNLSEYKLPDGKLISKEKEKITSEMVSDFHAFMEDVELFCENNCDLIGTYKNISDDNSYYYNYLATDDNGNIIIDYRLRLRVSNHLPKKSKQQNKHKTEELDSEKLKELLDIDEISKLKTYTKIITVNDEQYDDYIDAFESVCDIIENAVKVMKRNENNRLKKPISRNSNDQK